MPHAASQRGHVEIRTSAHCKWQYRIAMTFDGFGSRRGPEIAPAPDAMPTVFIAIREELGLELKSWKAELDTLVIDHLERPTEN